MKLLSYKNTFVATVLWTLLVSLLIFLTKQNLCEAGTMCIVVTEILEPLGGLLILPSLLLPILCLLWFFPRDVFIAWRKFAYYAVPLAASIAYLIENSSDTGVFIDLATPLYLGLLYGTFFAISLLIIFISAWSARK